jgi:hypothetical protein
LAETRGRKAVIPIGRGRSAGGTARVELSRRAVMAT